MGTGHGLRVLSSAALTVLLVTLCGSISAVQAASVINVGDDQGWTLNFDYAAWAGKHNFSVGDTLVFKYAKGAHNVYKVNGTAFAACDVSSNSVSYQTGNDQFVLNETGNKWYVCGVPGHCQRGMKLKITVNEASASPPPPTLTAVSAVIVVAVTFIVMLVL